MEISEVLEHIRKAIGSENLSRLRSRAGCRVDLTDAPSPRVVVDADLAFPAHGIGGRKCDYILFYVETSQNLVVVPIELKRGSINISEALAQLQGGADFAARFVPARRDFQTTCRPLLFHGGRVHRRKQKRKRANEGDRATVRFLGGNFQIKTARCSRPRNLADGLFGEI